MESGGTTRREFVKAVGAAAAGVTVSAGAASARTLRERSADVLIDPRPLYDLSPYLYMQFMEPLGTTDGSVAAAWDFGNDRWRPDVIDVTRELAPPMVRWGGCFASYYRWKQAVGPREMRPYMFNICWGGLDTQHVGTAEFVGFCRETGAEPLMCINFESDGKPYFARTPRGDDRLGNAAEAAAWVRYCNNPADADRIAHGHKDPLTIRLWQLGNETSYGTEWDAETCGRKSIEFARAMRAEDPDIELIGWGDSGWAPRVLEMAGEHLQYIAFHHMFDPGHDDPRSPLRGAEYRKDPARTWDYLMNSYKPHEHQINWMREQVAGYDVPIAMTECHYALPGRNRCEVLSTWAAGVANARMANLHERNGDRLKIATLADFCGTRWQVNALMIPVPGGRPFLMPVGLVMRLYRHHVGERAVAVASAPPDLDMTASRTGDRIYLHVVNTNRTRAVTADLAVTGRTIASGTVFELAADPEFEVMAMTADQLTITEKRMAEGGSRWTFPPASVSAVELDTHAA